MSRFREEFGFIPKTARFIAGLVYIVAAVAAHFALFVASGRDQGPSNAPEAVKFVLVLVPAMFLAVWVLLIGYVFGDAKRRGMRYIMWTLLAIFIPDAIGIILYFILRDPPLRACPGCARVVKSGYTFCPHCGVSLQPTCPNCGRAVESTWVNCPHCGTRLPSPAPRAA